MLMSFKVNISIGDEREDDLGNTGGLLYNSYINFF